MKRKHILALVALVAVFAMALTGCGKKDAAETAAPVQDESWGLTDWHLSASAWSSNNGASVTLTAVPSTYYQDVNASFVVRLEGEEAASVPCTWDGKQYTAMADLNAADGYCYYMVWDDGETQTEFEINTPAKPSNQLLINLEYSLESYCEMAVETSELKGSKLTVTKGAAQVRLPLISKNGESVGFQSIDLVLSHEGGECDRQSLTAPELNAMGTYDLEIKNVTFSVPDMEDDQQLALTIEITLTDGQVLTAPGGTWFYTDGQVALAVG